MSGKEFKFGFLISAALDKGFKQAFMAAGVQVNDFSKTIDDNTKKLNQGIGTTVQQGGKLSKLGKSFSDVALRLGKVGSAWTFAGKSFDFTKKILASSKAAIEFENAMADVKKVVNFEGDATQRNQQLKAMGKEILNLSTKIPMAANGLAQIVAAGGQSGIAAKDLTAFAESAAKMGIAFDITADQAGAMMAKWRTAFKMDQKQVETLADKINYLGNTTAASAPLISDVVTRIGPLGAVGGLAAGEIAAMGASLVGSGIQSEVAATGLKNFILTMTSGTSATKKQRETFAELGLDAEVLASKMQTDAKGAILEVLSAINSVDKAQQSAKLKDLFGKESIGAIAPLLTNIDNLKKNFEGVGDAARYAGSMQDEFDARSKTTGNSVQLMENRINAAKIAISSNLLPVITPLAEGLGAIAGAIGKVAEEYPNLTKLAVWGAVSLGVLSTLAGTLTTLYQGAKVLQELGMFKSAAGGISNLTKVTGIFGKVAQFAGGLVGTLGSMLSALPIGWVLIGISALVVAGTILYKNWDKVKAFFTTLWESPTARIAMFIAGPIGWLFGAVTYVISHWDELKSYLEYFWDNPSAAIFRFQNYFKEQIQGAIDWVFKKWEELKNFLSNPISVTVAKNMLNSGRYDVDNGEYEVDRNAAGGIYGKGAFLTTLAEESGESAIPHTPTRRNIGLLAETNRIMGNPLGGGGINATFAPVINVSGSADAGQISQMMDEKMHEFEAMLKRVADNRRRVSYA